jgi:hypothetical protein
MGTLLGRVSGTSIASNGILQPSPQQFVYGMRHFHCRQGSGAGHDAADLHRDDGTMPTRVFSPLS